jgi:ribosomal protein L7/L12
MNIGWIFLSCALLILVIMAVLPWWKKERANTQQEIQMFGANQNFSARLDDLDARLTRRDEITWLLQTGQKINAIKLYREETGASLADAKAAVERMELALRMGLVTPAEPRMSQMPATSNDAPESLTREVEALLMQGKKIQAIKLYREQTGLGLREAKEAIDLIENALRMQGPTSYQAGSADPETEIGLPVVEPPGAEVRRYVLEGKKIQAIKLYREQTGLGLREAKEAIDRLEQAIRQGMEQF